MSLNRASATAGLADERGWGWGRVPTLSGSDASHFSEAQCCVPQTLIVINFSEHRGTTTADFPLLSLVAADHASCFSKSFPDRGDLLFQIWSSPSGFPV